MHVRIHVLSSNFKESKCMYVCTRVAIFSWSVLLSDEDLEESESLIYTYNCDAFIIVLDIPLACKTH